MSEEAAAVVSPQPNIVAEKKTMPVWAMAGFTLVVIIAVVSFLFAMGFYPFNSGADVSDPTETDLAAALAPAAAASSPAPEVTPLPVSSDYIVGGQLGPDSEYVAIETTPVSDTQLILSQLTDLSRALTESTAATTKAISDFENKLLIQRSKMIELSDKFDDALVKMDTIEKRVGLVEEHNTDLQGQILSGDLGLIVGDRGEGGSGIGTQPMPQLTQEQFQMIRDAVIAELRSSGEYSISSTQSQQPRTTPVQGQIKSSIEQPLYIQPPPIEETLPFELVAIESWDLEPMAVISITGKKAVLGIKDSRLGYRLIQVDRLRKTATFLNISTNRITSLDVG